MSTSEAVANFAIGLSTTFLGALLAIGPTYLYDRRKARRTERDDRKKVLDTIHHELTSNLKRIERVERDAAAYRELEAKLNETKAQGVGLLLAPPDVRLERAALDTAIFSGKLFLLDKEILKELSENYRRIDVVNRNSEDLRAIARRRVTMDDVPTINGLIGVTTGYLKNLQDSIPGAIKKLQRKSDGAGDESVLRRKQRPLTQ